MKKNRIFEKYYSRLMWEGILKSLVSGLAAGLFVQFLIVFITWFTPFNGIWLSIGAGVLVAAVCALILYFKRFRPTTREIARRLDRLGLEERMITMMELENDESYIAMRQREDAREKLAALDNKALKFGLSLAAIVMLCVSLTLSVSMTTVAALTEAGVIAPPEEFIPGLGPEEKYFAVSYTVEEGGFIEGEEEQLVLLGEDATPVVAVAEDGWMFDSWDDGSTNPVRCDRNVQEELVLTAIFVPIDEDGDDADLPGDQPGDLPSDSGDGKEPSDEPSPGSSGKYEDHNQIIDGDTYYRDVYQEYYERAMEILAEGGEIPPELRAIIEAYFGIII